MQIGFIGAGNMARAMARGWGEPVLCTDSGSGRGQQIVDELGGERLQSNRELAARVDLVLLCHKPYQLDAVAREIAPVAKAVASVLGGTPLSTLATAYPDVPVFALMPNTPVEVRRGVVVHAEAPPDSAPPEALTVDVLRKFGELGRVVTVRADLLDAATSVSGVGPAYQALLVEAQIDAAIRLGVPAALATELVLATVAGSIALIEHRDGDTLQTRREVTSPGGSTARGLAALEAAGLRTAFQRAADAVTNPDRT